MESEIQKRRTYEIIAKFIGERTNITVTLNDEDKVCADPKTGEIHIPRNIKADNIYPAIAWMIHEASHIKHTKFIDAEKIIGDMVDFNILNACEDVRIDREAFNILPNVIGIYKEMLKIIKLKERATDPNIPIEVKVLSDCIMKMEWFDHATSKNPDIEKFIKDTSLINEMERLISILWSMEFQGGSNDVLNKDAAKQIKVIRDLLSNIKRQHQNKQKSVPESVSAESNDKTKEKGNNEGNIDAPTPNAPAPAPDSKLDLTRLDETSISGGVSRLVFGQLDTNAVNPSRLGTTALQEQTESAFKEILNQKEVQKIEQGQVLDTDNLTSFFTGDVGELFKEDIVVRKKKSKLIIVLDSSGSMGAQLMGVSERRADVVASTSKAITNILDEVHMLEGINVDYAVRSFNSGYYELSKENWQTDYVNRINGGTNLVQAFDKAQEELLNDYTIEGKRLIVLITDGDVSNDQIDSIKKSIVRHNADVRAMVLGVGAEINGSFVKNVSGHNIITKDLADVVLMEAITDLLI